ncbi:hypothetical protein ACH5RR_040455 [Cinchona calisaya]|uniref:Uncharacterized protein n=1 Tax=Cinchona calisaya TaxID=153742 RepID=A0ABD2XSR6_9GENT
MENGLIMDSSLDEIVGTGEGVRQTVEINWEVLVKRRQIEGDSITRKKSNISLNEEFIGDLGGGAEGSGLGIGERASQRTSQGFLNSPVGLEPNNMDEAGWVKKASDLFLVHVPVQSND